MTKIKIGIWDWRYLVIVLDWFTKKIIGYHLRAYNLKENLFLVVDNSCQPTSIPYMKVCSDLGAKQVFIIWSSPSTMPKLKE